MTAVEESSAELSASEFRQAMGHFATGVTVVTSVGDDGEPVGTGAPGPLTLELRERYWDSHQDPRYSTPVRYDEPG